MSNYKKFKIERLDSISPTFCAAKWTTADFWLETGTTSSCHLPAPHTIDLTALGSNINTIHNTKQKLHQKEQMLAGLKPSGCSNCWQVEEANNESMSERIVSSYLYSQHDFNSFDLSDNSVPDMITVSFDSLCNFTCSYCDASQSSSWFTDLKINGPYKQIYGDPRNTYQRLGTSKRLSLADNTFINHTFTDYVIKNLKNIRSIRCLGGEPLISPNFWKFLDNIAQYDCTSVTLHVVTNLSDLTRLTKLLNQTTKFKKIIIEASIENIEARAEFIRTGISWETFNTNLTYLLAQRIDVILLATISNAALDGLVEFLNWYTNKAKYIGLEIYRLRHPNFQAMQVLPMELKLSYSTALTTWLTDNEQYISNQLNEQVKNIVTILKDDCIIYNDTDITILRNSAKTFYREYAIRHSHNIRNIFSTLMADWILN